MSHFRAGICSELADFSCIMFPPTFSPIGYIHVCFQTIREAAFLLLSKISLKKVLYIAMIPMADMNKGEKKKSV